MLPTPPSVNAMFRNVAGVGRVKTTAYKQWTRTAGWQVVAQKAPEFAGPVAVLIEADLPRNRDIDNAIKAVLDLLVSVNVLSDDRLVDDLRIARRGSKTEARVTIWRIRGAGVAAA